MTNINNLTVRLTEKEDETVVTILKKKKKKKKKKNLNVSLKN